MNGKFEKSINHIIEIMRKFTIKFETIEYLNYLCTLNKVRDSQHEIKPNIAIVSTGRNRKQYRPV